MSDCYIVRRGGGSVSTKLPEFTYTGQYNLSDDGEGNWRLFLLTSGTLKFTKLSANKVDVFAVGGGASGGSRESGSDNWGCGGGGGYTKTQKGITVATGSSYEIVIGAGGASVSGNNKHGKNGGDTTALGVTAKGGYGGGYAYTANGDTGGDGGSGGSGYNGYGGTDGADGTGGSPKGNGQGTTTREFAESGCLLYSTGGDCQKSYINSGAANTGDGGDGGKGGASGAGGSGIVVIRNAR